MADAYRASAQNQGRTEAPQGLQREFWREDTNATGHAKRYRTHGIHAEELTLLRQGVASGAVHLSSASRALATPVLTLF